MLDSNMLTSTAIDMCPAFQPNSRLWQMQAGLMTGYTGMIPGGFAMPASLPAAMKPSIAMLMAESARLTGHAGTTGAGGNPAQAADAGKIQFTDAGLYTANPQRYPGLYRDYNNLNKPNNGNHSRSDGWSSPQAKRNSADPGGGSTTS